MKIINENMQFDLIYFRLVTSFHLYRSWRELPMAKLMLPHCLLERKGCCLQCLEHLPQVALRFVFYVQLL